MDDIKSPTAIAVASGSTSAVSWSAIFAGTAVAVASSLVLFALTAGLDLAALAPDRATSATSLTVLTGIALVVTQWISAALGGYMTGRLRTRWVSTHTHEVFFRDTAHGFITWCVATVVMASGLASASATFPSGHIHVTAGSHGRNTRLVSAGFALPGSARSATAAFAAAAPVTDRAVRSRLVLPDGPAAVESASAYRPAAMQMPPASHGARAAVEAQSLWPADLSTSSGDDGTRKAAAATSIITALSMLVGAFIASVSAALGGRLRDLHP
jgi:hypothetical protein